MKTVAQSAAGIVAAIDDGVEQHSNVIGNLWWQSVVAELLD